MKSLLHSKSVCWFFCFTKSSGIVIELFYLAKSLIKCIMYYIIIIPNEMNELVNLRIVTIWCNFIFYYYSIYQVCTNIFQISLQNVLSNQIFIIPMFKNIFGRFFFYIIGYILLLKQLFHFYQFNEILIAFHNSFYGFFLRIRERQYTYHYTFRI